jgi:hypothetical protein
VLLAACLAPASALGATLRAAAAARGMKANALARLILQTVVKDSLYDAVLDMLERARPAAISDSARFHHLRLRTSQCCLPHASTPAFEK